jgi:hypothetical protein
VVAHRVSGLSTRADGKTDGDFAYHLETGLTKAIGLHIRNSAFLTNSHTEAMFQFAAIMSKDGMSSFAALIEFEFSTLSGAGSRIEPLIGFTTTLANSRVSFNQDFHYGAREDAAEGSAALVRPRRKGGLPGRRGAWRGSERCSNRGRAQGARARGHQSWGRLSVSHDQQPGFCIPRDVATGVRVGKEVITREPCE